jgi:A/G-specific adenine glycosylase
MAAVAAPAALAVMAAPAALAVMAAPAALAVMAAPAAVAALAAVAAVAATAAVTELAAWYRRNGRHDLPWRQTRDRWAVLVSEVMLHQTQVPRVAAVWPRFIAQFPIPRAMAAARLGSVIAAWGTLGYPRRARRLWEAATVIVEQGWPDDLARLPGIGRYTARAVAAQADGADLAAVEVNGRRVAERVAGRRLTDRETETVMREIGAPLRGRDRLLALMDVGALACRPREPRCADCPLQRRCATRGVRPGERRSRQGRFEGSFRQRRGRVMAALREGARVDARLLDREALGSLVDDGLAVIDDEATARLP